MLKIKNIIMLKTWDLNTCCSLSSGPGVLLRKQSCIIKESTRVWPHCLLQVDSADVKCVYPAPGTRI